MGMTVNMTMSMTIELYKSKNWGGSIWTINIMLSFLQITSLEMDR
jgi:hypothetical protein